MRFLPILLALAVVQASPTRAVAAAPRDIERMTAYATLLGRALGCGLDVAAGTRKVTAWLDKTFPPGTEEQRRYLSEFANTMRTEADLQAAGKTSVTCAKVGQMTKSMGW